MAKVRVQALRTDKAGNSMAVWLAAHHPDMFVTLLQKAKAAKAAKKLQGLGDDGLTTSFDASSDTFNPGFDPTAAADTSGSLSSFDPTLTTVSIDDSALDSMSPNLLTDANSSGADSLAALGGTPTSSGVSVAQASQSSGNSFLSALGQVGSFIVSKPGLTALTNLATTIAGTTQGQVLQTQIARTSANQTAAPITYTRDALGNLVPVYATQTPQGTLYQPLTPSGIQSLTPSNLSVLLNQYGGYIAVAAAVIVGLIVAG